MNNTKLNKRLLKILSYLPDFLKPKEKEVLIEEIIDIEYPVIDIESTPEFSDTIFNKYKRLNLILWKV